MRKCLSNWSGSKPAFLSCGGAWFGGPWGGGGLGGDTELSATSAASCSAAAAARPRNLQRGQHLRLGALFGGGGGGGAKRAGSKRPSSNQWAAKEAAEAQQALAQPQRRRPDFWRFEALPHTASRSPRTTKAIQPSARKPLSCSRSSATWYLRGLTSRLFKSNHWPRILATVNQCCRRFRMKASSSAGSAASGAGQVERNGSITRPMRSSKTCITCTLKYPSVLALPSSKPSPPSMRARSAWSSSCTTLRRLLSSK
mmetsp:Transcript_6307/g.17612  ORF Transcript_6307/g.17612 Transcript_6307/m.17612 type:complete len:256 (+) Transcript_6307:302-1069(+)